MTEDAFSTIDSCDELTYVCGGAGGGGGARDTEPPPTNSDKRSLNLGVTKDGQQYGLQVSRESTSSNYALCLGKHPTDTMKECGPPPP